MALQNREQTTHCHKSIGDVLGPYCGCLPQGKGAERNGSRAGWRFWRALRDMEKIACTQARRESSITAKGARTNALSVSNVASGISYIPLRAYPDPTLDLTTWTTTVHLAER